MRTIDVELTTARLLRWSVLLAGMCRLLAADSEVDERAAEAAMDARLRRIQAACGELCNTRRPTWGSGVVGKSLNSSSAPVPCTWLLADDSGLDAVREQRWPPQRLPGQWMDEFTMHGRYRIGTQYFNVSEEMLAGHSARGAEASNTITPGWSRKDVDIQVEFARARSGATRSQYHWLNVEVWKALQQVNVSGHNVLVVGSQSPWVEVEALASGAAHVWTLEYAMLSSDHPQLTPLAPPAFLEAARSGQLPRMDAIITASSVEHSGLGRYNDALNPWGDILAIARTWCVSAPKASLVIAVPMNPNMHHNEPTKPADAALQERLRFNDQRIYGPIRYPYLTTNWKFEYRIAPTGGPTHRRAGPGWGQTVYVFSREDAQTI